MLYPESQETDDLISRMQENITHYKEELGRMTENRDRWFQQARLLASLGNVEVCELEDGSVVVYKLLRVPNALIEEHLLSKKGRWISYEGEIPMECKLKFEARKKSEEEVPSAT